MTTETMQDLLDEQATLSNRLYKIEQLIRAKRNTTPPLCFGQDDCSTMTLSVCPYRMDCNGETK